MYCGGRNMYTRCTRCIMYTRVSVHVYAWPHVNTSRECRDPRRKQERERERAIRERERERGGRQRGGRGGESTMIQSIVEHIMSGPFLFFGILVWNSFLVAARTSQSASTTAAGSRQLAESSEQQASSTSSVTATAAAACDCVSSAVGC